MTETVLVALLSLLGTLMGSLSGIVATSKLTNFRLQQLEEKVARHNSVVERTYALEGRMNEAEHDIRDIKERRKDE